MLGLDDDVITSKKPDDILEKLANALNCSTETFFEITTHESCQTIELVNAWLSIKNAQDRSKLLSLVVRLNSEN